MEQALIKYLRCADDDHVLIKMVSPGGFRPKITSHVTTEVSNILVQVAFENRELLENKCNAIDLRPISFQKTRMSHSGNHKEKRDAPLPAYRSILELLINDMLQ